ncbi:Arabinose operon regulatory protein [compost metagenome]
MQRASSYYVISNPVAQHESQLMVLFAGESQTKPNHQLGPKVYDYYLLHHVIAGKGRFTCLGQESELHAGDSFIITPEQLVSYVSDEADPWHYRWIAFTGTQSSELVASIGLSAAQPIIRSNEHRHIAVLYHQIQYAFRSKHPGLHLKVNGYLHLLLAAYSEILAPMTVDALETDDDTKNLVQQAIHYLSTQYAEPITIEGMADSLGYNRAYLSRVFKRYTQVTPVTFLLKLRLDKARLLLRERLELTIEQIASSVGFHDPLYFSKQFRRWHGASPSEYRLQIKSL